MPSMTSCRFITTDQPRMLRTHVRDCNASGCEGCMPCEERHCADCGRRHVEELRCASCVGAVRGDIGLIVQLSARLLPEATHRGVNSEAAMLAGPAANAEAFSNLNVSARAGRIDGSLLVDNCDEPHPAWTLGTWDMLVRELLDQPTTIRITVERAADYLRDQLTELARREDFAWEELARDVRQCRGHLEDVLRDGTRDEKGGLCPMCGVRALVKRFGGTEDEDRWTCPQSGCDASYTEHDYREKVDAVYVLHADALTAAQVTHTYRVPEATVRKWAQRGQVRRHRRGGVVLYDVDDVKHMTGRDTAESA